MDFPENKLGLKRGTVLEAIHPAVSQLGLEVGMTLAIGFDGTYVRSGPYTWSVEQLVAEIEEHHVWRVSGELDLSDPLVELRFTMLVEQHRPSEDLLRRAVAAADQAGLLEKPDGSSGGN